MELSIKRDGGKADTRKRPRKCAMEEVDSAHRNGRRRTWKIRAKSLAIESSNCVKKMATASSSNA